VSLAGLAAVFGQTFLVSLSGALSPGPLSTMAVREGVGRGAAAGPLLAAGHSALELAVVVGLVSGLGEVLQGEVVGAGIALAGGLLLLWLGWQTLLAGLRRPALSLEKGAATRGRGIAGLLLAGVLVSVSNPFFLAWWGTVGARLLGDALAHGAAGVATLYMAHILTDFGWLALLSSLSAGGRRLLGTAFYRLLLSLSGLALAGMGGWFLARAWLYFVPRWPS